MERKDGCPIDSREWWEKYFKEDWDSHGGSEQTRYFMQRLLAELPPPEVAFLRSRPLTILDWGCAFGEGVEVLSKAIPQGRVVGLDFASIAIEQARQRHPHHEFILAENGEITGEFDVVATSNRLEHFEYPLEIVKTNLRSCRELYIALVPYNEFPLSEYHRSQFKEESFPEHIGNFVRLYTKVLDADPLYCNGQQLLVVYSPLSYFLERSSFEGKVLEQEKWDKYYASLPLFAPDEATQAFGTELVERVLELLPAGSRILEAGCGGGWQSLALARSGRFQVSLMDFSREALEYARRLFEREELHAEFIYCDVFTHGEPEFDLVFNAGVLEHYTLEEQAAFLRGMASRSRNYVLALVPNRICYWYWLWRIQRSSRGEWPFGKEVPQAEFSVAFQEAGLQFLGQTFMAQEWAESFVEGLAGIDRRLRDDILNIHRSPLIPKEQKSYLLAGLGTVLAEPQQLPNGWMPSPAPEDMQKAELNSALADALALRVGAELRLSQLELRVSEEEQNAQRLAAQLADKEQDVERLSSDVTERGQDMDRLLARVAETEQTIQSLSEHIAEKEHALQALASELTEKEHKVQALSAQLSENEQALSSQIVKQQNSIQLLSAEVAENDNTIGALSSEIVKKENSIELLSAKVAKKDNTIATLASEMATKEQTADSLSFELNKKERAVQNLSEALAEKEAELNKITKTLGWRWLSRYGRIKYRYLLPVYKALGLPPYDTKTISGAQRNQLPLDQSAEQAQSTSLPESGGPMQSLKAQPVRQERPYLSNDSNAHEIVCFPIIDWDFRFQRPQQLMSRFAAAGHRVFYISQAFHASGEPYLVQQKGNNIYEVSLRGPSLSIYADKLDDRTRNVLFTSLNALRRDLSLGATAAFVQLPFWWPLAKQARDEFAWPIVYDCMDYHAGFSTNQRTMVDQERALLASADLVIVSSSFLETEAADLNSRVLLVRNACDYEHFAKANGRRGARPVVGYYGAIADWFDADLVADLAERRPDWDFLLVGSTFSADTRRLSKLPNVDLPGEKHYSAIPDLLGTFDVAIIPFKRIPLTEATNPVKAYEILASGKPLVSVPIPEMASLVPFVRLASTVDEFEKEIREVLEGDPEEMRERRRAFAREHTWDKRFEALSPAVRLTFPKVSIIIVTFNNLELNRLCLESLYARTEWPTLEVIVVDNASEDGTPQYLKYAEKIFPDLRVVLNERNLGFAAANNIGLKQATGEYLVLLNNDTVLTRGWLSALIRHLQEDPTIGLIGPTTNEIGNEAKVPVGYERLEDMPRWAANYVRDNDNRLFPIPMLAMFCVMMRREVFERVGLLDDEFQIGMFEDDDYTRRVREKGYRVACTYDSFVHHAGRASFKTLSNERYLEIFQRNRKIYEKKWGLWQPHMDNQAGESVRSVCNQMRKIIDESGIDPSRIVLFPSWTGWSDTFTQRPHHLASELARQGFLVFFDCSGTTSDDFAGFVRAKTNLWLYKGPHGVLDTLGRSILWAFPNSASRADRWADRIVVYDWIGDLSTFSSNQKWLREDHKRVLQRADLVLCAARDLHNQAKEQRPDALYVPNGVEYSRFSSPTNSVALDVRFLEILNEGRPVVGYYGAVSSLFDVDLLQQASEARPDWSFVVIGHLLPDAPSLEALENKPNVLILRDQQYESIPGYLARFSAAAIPFKMSHVTEAAPAINLYEYFAAGRPVIGTPIPECREFEEVLLVRNAHEFSGALNIAKQRNGDPSFQKRLRFLASENSWTALVQTVAAELSKKLKESHT